MLLQVDNVTLCEVHGQEKRPVVTGMELLVLSIVPTQAEVDATRAQLGLSASEFTVGTSKPLVFAVCGNYKIPLAANVPTIQESPISYVFAVPGLFMAALFPPETDAEIIEAFELLVKTYGVLRQRAQPPKFEQPQYGASRAVGAAPAAEYMQRAPDGSVVQVGQPTLASKVAGGITTVSLFAVRGLRKGAEVLAGGISKGSAKIVEKTDRCEQPVAVPAEVNARVQQARMVTKSAVLVSSGLAATMIGVTGVLGTGLSKLVGSRVSARTGGGPNPKLEAVKEVAGAGVGAVALVYTELTDAARVLLTASCDGIGRVVTHKFGEEVGQTTVEGLGLVQDAVQLQQNVSSMGVKGLAKSTLRHTGHQLMEADAKNQPGGPAPGGPTSA